MPPPSGGFLFFERTDMGTSTVNQTSSLTTASVTVSAATIAPLVTWAINGFHNPMPETVPYLIAAALVTAGHFILNVVRVKFPNASKDDAPPAQ
jgi:hypothetical protein